MQSLLGSRNAIIDLKTSAPSSILEANKLSLMGDSGLRTKELHEFLSNRVAAFSQGTLKEGNVTVLCLCNGGIFAKRGKSCHTWRTMNPLQV